MGDPELRRFTVVWLSATTARFRALIRVAWVSWCYNAPGLDSESESESESKSESDFGRENKAGLAWPQAHRRGRQYGQFW